MLEAWPTNYSCLLSLFNCIELIAEFWISSYCNLSGLISRFDLLSTAKLLEVWSYVEIFCSFWCQIWSSRACYKRQQCSCSATWKDSKIINGIPYHRGERIEDDMSNQRVLNAQVIPSLADVLILPFLVPRISNKDTDCKFFSHTVTSF